MGNRIKVDLMDFGWEGVEWFQLAKVLGCREHGDEASGFGNTELIM
jgi:hypothetical protein